ncbi:hypothetical protein PHYSODRAFT_475888 [Phytophthora sojae]|uniref:Uncharacterized protein n=1 Tax=Phytophthora sojae (strain P6497) TaxID=1094619 RepID=G4YIS4_PHYSP|nr:hypothetical protein PHYSODRAFT_475888 [Phytophthora sojae]EGZ28494.1 hypothetical protein PHYSODRAFT_475888 [Phytophthora sojae]|eukprot:XP_009515769.1 hypothetical protein PHYSODRAFT_475888 [Phytophthora sojae]
MNSKSNDLGPPCTTKDPRRKKVFQRRLHNQLTESRMLEVLDRNEQDEQEEEELVCVSKMVKMVEEEPAVSRSSEFQVGGVLKTVRYIHRQRTIEFVQQENQAEH